MTTLAELPRVLVATPVKDAAAFASTFVDLLLSLSYPAPLLSVAFGEGDSSDGTFEAFQRELPRLRAAGVRRVSLFRRDVGYRLPAGLPRWEPTLQHERRSALARARNDLLVRALRDEDWVLWLDSDLRAVPSSLVQTLLAYERPVVHPRCTLEPGGPTFDTNAWRDEGATGFDALLGCDELEPLDAVGGTVLLVRADLHRDGLVFPSWPHGAEDPRARRGWREIGRPVPGEVETEGLGLLAHQLGAPPVGIPHLEVQHHRR